MRPWSQKKTRTNWQEANEKNRSRAAGLPFWLKGGSRANPLQQCETAWVVVFLVLFCEDVSFQFGPCRPVAAIGSRRIPRSG